MPGDFPERIVCLTEETTESLYLFGEDARISSITGASRESWA
jgi:iron complex transport system substrate-binding protein